MAGRPPTGSRPLAAVPTEAPPATGAGGRVPPPEVLRGMLQAARASLGQGRYGEAIAAYQAVLKRDQNNVDAMTHLALIVAIGGGPQPAHRAPEKFDRAPAIRPNYPPAPLSRGPGPFEAKQEVG